MELHDFHTLELHAENSFLAIPGHYFTVLVGLYDQPEP